MIYAWLFIFNDEVYVDVLIVINDCLVVIFWLKLFYVQVSIHWTRYSTNSINGVMPEKNMALLFRLRAHIILKHQQPYHYYEFFISTWKTDIQNPGIPMRARHAIPFAKSTPARIISIEKRLYIFVKPIYWIILLKDLAYLWN